MILTTYGQEPYGTAEQPSPCGGAVLVQYDEHGGDIGVGITLNRQGLEQYLSDNPAQEATYIQPDNGLEFFTRMDRSQINRLIGQLRTARDAAFGADV